MDAEYVGQCNHSYVSSIQPSSLKFRHTLNDEHYSEYDADADINKIIIATTLYHSLHAGTYLPDASDQWCDACHGLLTAYSVDNFTARIAITRGGFGQFYAEEVHLSQSETLCPSCLQLNIAHELKVWELLSEALTRSPAPRDTRKKIASFLQHVKQSIDKRDKCTMLKPAKH